MSEDCRKEAERIVKMWRVKQKVNTGDDPDSWVATWDLAALSIMFTQALASREKKGWNEGVKKGVKTVIDICGESKSESFEDLRDEITEALGKLRKP